MGNVYSLKQPSLNYTLVTAEVGIYIFFNPTYSKKDIRIMYITVIILSCSHYYVNWPRQMR